MAVSNKVTETDCIIVGAGLSGLSAARKLHEAGKSFIVLEARDRVGGRTWSNYTASGGNLDTGASFVNEHIQPEVTKLLREAQNPIFEVNADGPDVLVIDPASGTRIMAGAGQEDPLAAVTVKVDALAKEVDTEDITKTPNAAELDAISILTWYVNEGVSEDALVLLIPIINSLFGAGGEEISFLYFLYLIKLNGGSWAGMANRDSKGGQYQRTQKGTQSMSTYLASLLPQGSVKLSQPVASINSTQAGSVTVLTRGGDQFKASTVILTLATPLISTIRFEPHLPVDKTVATARSFLGYYAKCTFVYAKPWWYESGHSGTAAFADGYINSILDSTDGVYNNSADKAGLVPKQYSLSCFVTGKGGMDWSKLSKEEREAVARKAIGDAFNNHDEAAKTIEEVHQYEWMFDEWAQGAGVSLYAPGHFLLTVTDHAAPAGRIFFAGTDNSPVWKGYMEGAVLAGRQAAGQVINWLGANVATVDKQRATL